MEKSENNDTVQPNGLFDIEGRIGRTRYVVTNLLAIIVMLPISIAIGDRNSGGQLLLVIVTFLVLAPTAIKRLHDINRNGTWLWALLIPFFNIVVQLRLLFQSGTPNSNRFGIRSDVKRHPIRMTVSPSQSEPEPSNMDDIYNEISQEFESGILDKGLWIRFFAECDGNENQTKARYIRERAKILISQTGTPKKSSLSNLEKINFLVLSEFDGQLEDSDLWTKLLNRSGGDKEKAKVNYVQIRTRQTLLTQSTENLR